MTPSPNLIPVLPDSAPFTAEQRAYLNGFFAGMFSRVPAPASGAVAASPANQIEPLSILFGSQTGTAEKLAKRIAKEAGKRGFAPTVHDLAKFSATQLAAESRVLLVASTFGDGEPPDNAKQFWESLRGAGVPRLDQTRFSVLGLGDANYPKFCGFGKALDERLAELGARRVHPRTDCDVDFERAFQTWLGGALPALANAGTGTTNPDSTPGGASVIEPEDAPAKPGTDREFPFAAPLIGNHRLTGEQGSKDVRHFALSIAGSGLRYEPGDALGVVPQTCPALVEELVGVLQADPGVPVPVGEGLAVSLREALLAHYEITRIPRSLLQEMAKRTGDATLLRLTQPEVNGELTEFLRGREIIDLLLAHPEVRFAPDEFCTMLRRMQPRLYSISSSQRAHSDEVHLTVNVVRYESLGRARQGVCSTFLAGRVSPNATVPIFFKTNPGFRLPADPARPLIMVGPGTGVAPFRAFLEDRRAAGAKGRHWLFFGDQREASDFLYREELAAMRADGTLTRLDLAWSREQERKVYVQHRMAEQGKDLFAWLEEGAHFYVCGDAGRMAKDVEDALCKVVETAGGRTPEQAAEYLRKLQSDGRYQRDVY